MRPRPGSRRAGLLLLALAPLLLAGCTSADLPDVLGGEKGGTFAVEVMNDSSTEVAVVARASGDEGGGASKEFSLLPSTSARHTLRAPANQFAFEADITAKAGEGTTRVAETAVDLAACDGLLLYRITLAGDRDALSARATEVKCES